MHLLLRLTLGFIFCLVVFQSNGQFITTWQTTKSITIPTEGTGYNYTVDWGDGTLESGFTGDATHTYTNSGVYTISISGDFPRIYFNNAGDKNKILTIEQWGNIEWKSMAGAFYGCSNLSYNATDIPDLTQVSDLSYMFYGAHQFNGDIGSWDVSNVSNFSYMFLGTTFNQDIGSWDVSSGTDFSNMFFDASAFNQDIGSWDVSNGTQF